MTAPPLICHVLPRGMAYSSARATSIDLFVSEVCAHSRLRHAIIAEFAEPRLPAAQVVDLPRYAIANTIRRAGFIARAVREMAPDLVIVQQHQPSAAGIARRIATPVILQKHNFVKTPREGLIGRLSKARHVREFSALAGLTLVSEAVKAEFERHWPEVTIPRCVVNNGIETALWRPHSEREKTVLVVGRAAPEKGALEAAQALARVLPEHDGWTATFIVSEPGRHAAYFEQMKQALAPLGARAKVRVGVPFSEVKAASERAAIALIPSKWAEPFGRTCVEAHAGGAAVISSGTGGLREISGTAALYLSKVDAGAIAAAVTALIDDDALRERLAAEGRARVLREFDLAKVAGRLDDFCVEVMEAHRRGR